MTEEEFLWFRGQEIQAEWKRANLGHDALMHVFWFAVASCIIGEVVSRFLG